MLNNEKTFILKLICYRDGSQLLLQRLATVVRIFCLLPS